MITKRKALRSAVDIGILCGVSVYGSLHIWWHGLALCVVVAAYGLFCFWDGVDDATGSRRDTPKPPASSVYEELGVVTNHYLRTGDLDSLARIGEILRGSNHG